MTKSVIKDKIIALRIEKDLFNELLKLSLEKSKIEKRNVGVSDIVRNILKKEVKWK
jgi:hypothetical protein